ncbi:MAG TPA: T9SS type A sorting domain-containing protein, partial [Prolixibacteraceae bacterium]|nr:T9SS type A sorting domain-containing protein [Prolixibacteraceae bacterium]
ITIAGGGNPVVVQSGATVRFIAGQSIQLLPGFHAQESSSVHAFITTDGSFCDVSPTPSIVQLPPVAEKSASQNSTIEEANDQPFQPHLKAYPNPSNGEFTLEINNFDEQTEIVVFNMLGMVVSKIKNNNSSQVDINLPYWAKGIYNIRVTDGLREKSVKMIIQ